MATFRQKLVCWWYRRHGYPEPHLYLLSDIEFVLDLIAHHKYPNINNSTEYELWMLVCDKLRINYYEWD